MNNSEYSSLTGNSRFGGKVGFIFNVAVVLFVFFAFVFSAASLAKLNKSEANPSTTNNYFPFGSASSTYKVAANHQVNKGHIVSFSDNQGEVGRGLGPQWNFPAFMIEAGWSPSGARTAEISHFSDTAAVYAFSPLAEPKLISVVAANTPASGNVTLGGGSNYTAEDFVTFVHVRGLDATHFVVLFSTYNNDTGHKVFLMSGQVSADYSRLTLLTPQTITVNYQWNVTLDMTVMKNEKNAAQAWLLVTYAPEFTACNTLWWNFNPSAQNFLTPFVPISTNFALQCMPPIKGHYLSGGNFVFGNRFGLTLANIDFSNRVTQTATAYYGMHMYETISLTSIPDRNLLVVSGIQAELAVDGNMMITQVVSWTPSALNVHSAVVLLPTVRFEAYHNHLRSCYIPPDNFHPSGVLLFTYVDNENLRTSVVRGKINQYEDYYWILSSPRLSVSHVPYVQRRFGERPREWWDEPVGPLLMCSGNQAVMVLQSYLASINSFRWHGGYRVAGIAETGGSGGSSIKVTRSGIVTGLEYPLQTGFSYYANNSGDLHPTLSSTELYARNGFIERIGQCVNQNELVIDFEVFENINNRV